MKKAVSLGIIKNQKHESTKLINQDAQEGA